MRGALKTFERAVASALILVIVVVVIMTLLELVWSLEQHIVAPPLLREDLHGALDLFGMVLLVLIGLELIETVAAYFADGHVRGEVVILTAMIAVARRIVVLHVEGSESLALLVMGTAVLALAVAYRLFRRPPPMIPAVTPAVPATTAPQGEAGPVDSSTPPAPSSTPRAPSSTPPAPSSTPPAPSSTPPAPSSAR
jgi:uncharacterized membrane protein (DUF373 family)